MSKRKLTSNNNNNVKKRKIDITNNNTTKEKIIDPKNKCLGVSYWNLGNHVLLLIFIMCLVFVVYNSY